MQDDEFWTLVELARRDAASAGADWPSGTAIGQALTGRLAHLPAEAIVDFSVISGQVRAQAHQWSLCAAMWAICDYVSDDSFNDFKAGLVGLGRERFQQAVTDADTLADHPMVQAVASGQLEWLALLGEAIAFAAPKAYEQQADGDADAFWQALDDLPAVHDRDVHVPGERWSGAFGSEEDVQLIPMRLPRLRALFPQRGSGRH